MSLLRQWNDPAGNDGALISSSSWSDGRGTIPARRNDVRAYEIDGEAVLFEPNRKRMLLLNQTALAVWRRCDGRATIREIAEAMSREYDVAFGTALDHVEELIALFSSSNLLDHGMVYQNER